MPHPDFVTAAVRLAKLYPHSPPGRASHYLHHFHALFKSGRVRGVVLWCRVSTGGQRRRGNLEQQDQNLRQIVDRYRVPVLGTSGFTGSGAELEEVRLWLSPAI